MPGPYKGIPPPGTSVGYVVGSAVGCSGVVSESCGVTGCAVGVTAL
jgi:hypothetical protein